MADFFISSVGGQPVSPTTLCSQSEVIQRCLGCDGECLFACFAYCADTCEATCAFGCAGTCANTSQKTCDSCDGGCMWSLKSSTTPGK